MKKEKEMTKGGRGGGETGGEEKKLSNCFEDTTTKVADSGRKEMNPCSHACEEQRSGTKNFAARAAPPYFHFPSVMICLTRASEGAGEIWSLQEGGKESKQASWARGWLQAKAKWVFGSESLSHESNLSLT